VGDVCRRGVCVCVRVCVCVSAVPVMGGRENGTGGNTSEEVRRARAWVLRVDVVYVFVCLCVCVCVQCLRWVAARMGRGQRE